MILGDLETRDNLSTRIVMCGGALAVGFGMDSFLGAMLLAWYGVYLVLGFWRYRKSQSAILRGAVLSGLVVIGMLVLYVPIGILDPTRAAGSIQFAPYSKLIALAPVFLIVEFGVLSVLGLLGSVTHFRDQPKDLWMRGVLLIFVGLLFLFLVQHPLSLNIVARKAANVIVIGFLLLSGRALCYLGERRTRILQLLKLVLISIACISSVSLFTDIYVFSNNRSSFYSTFIDPQDYRGIRWVIENTPSDSVVQSLPQYRSPGPPPRESYRVSLFSQLGERIMALGDPKFAAASQTSDDTCQQRMIRIEKMFETDSPDTACNIAQRYAIDYVYVGTYEREVYPFAHVKLMEAPNLFEHVYHSSDVDIFRVLDCDSSP
jgi:uncharacterized membrane protein